MAVKCAIETPHPFQHERGVSHPERLLPILNPEQVQIDGRSLPELITFIGRLSRQVVYPSMSLSQDSESVVVVNGSWSLFFEDSIPFLIAQLSGIDRKKLDEQYTERLDMARQLRTREGVQLLIRFIYDELIKPVRLWRERLNQSDNSFNGVVEREVNSTLKQNLHQFISLVNGANRWYGTITPDFGLWQNDPVWELEMLDLYAIDESFHNEPTYRRRILQLIQELNAVGQAFLNATRRIADEAPSFFNESLEPLKEEYQQNHPPHLGLLFAFLTLFTQFQNSLNKLSTKHLRFFYEGVLNIKPKEATPDHVHLIMDVARHLSLPYKVDKGTAVKGEKDANQADVLFNLDDEIILDKAKVETLKTLYLNPVSDADTSYVEGIYMAPDATMADGVEAAFPGDGPNFWPTLGAKYSNLLVSNTQTTVAYPPARLGWLFASSVLLLEEGQRTITVCMACQGCNTQDTRIIEAIENAITNDNIEAFTSSGGRFLTATTKLENLFIVSLSGKKGWIVPEVVTTKLFFRNGQNTCNDVNVPNNGFILQLTITLKPEDDAVTFFDKDVLKEDYDTSLPVIKIELNPALKFSIIPQSVKTECGLVAKSNTELMDVSLYNYLRYVRLVDTKIKVKVCGLRNLIVQNDDSLQDVNSPMLPFGSRPKIGSNFYVGSPEMFSKKWERFSLNIDWEGKNDVLRVINPPAPVEQQRNGLRDYYHGYEDSLTNVVSLDFANTKFRFSSALLQSGEWKTNPIELITVPPPLDSPLPELFPINSDSIVCPLPDDIYNYNFDSNSYPEYVAKVIRNKQPVLSRLDTNSLDGFLRITLQGQDFQHDRYSFVLARQMMALGKFPDVYVGPVYDGFNPTTNATLPSLNIDAALNMLINVYKKLYIDFDLTSEFIEDGGLQKKLENIINVIREKKQEDENRPFPPPFPPLTVDFNESLTKDALGDPISTTEPGDGVPLGSGVLDMLTTIQGVTSNPPGHAINPSDPLFDDPNSRVIPGGFTDLYRKLLGAKDKRVVIPKEPYTPTIKSISIDYEAIGDKEDIVFLHLYPYEKTYKTESLSATPEPTLLPTFSQEGYLFVGFTELRPGSTLNLLFQLAQATADSELDRQPVDWAYLRNNDWRPLRTGFELIADDTNGLTRSGIIKLAIPTDISREKTTILPASRDKPLHWLRASICSNARALADTIGLHTQAVRATFTVQSTSDTTRLAKALPAKQISALAQANSSVSQVSQPYESFGGKPAEAINATELSLAFYGRVSERLRHKGRAIDTFDYERIVLEAFPTIFRAKCISHAFGLSASQQFPCEPNPCDTATTNPSATRPSPCDEFKPQGSLAIGVGMATGASTVVCKPARYRRDLELAPGFVLLAVIPDVDALKGSDRFGPRVPVSLLEEIEQYLKPRLSPFVRLKVMNPRYEAVNILLAVALRRGYDEVYHQQQLANDLRLFFSPWVNGNLDKLAFGQLVRRSDLIQFVEQRPYVDFIHGLRMGHEDEKSSANPTGLSENPQVNPLTARSILIAGELTVCIYHC